MGVSPASTQDAITQTRVQEVIDRLLSVDSREPTLDDLPDGIAQALTHYSSSLAVESADGIRLARAIYGALVIVWREGVDFGKFLES